MQNNTFSTLFVGQNLITLSSVDSTNNFLKMMLSKSEPLPEGTVIMADNQYAGRGQQQNTWYAQAGLNLTISLYLRPVFLAVNRQFMLNIAISNGISNALKSLVSDGISVKWPNDVYYHDRKIGGVLIENSIAGNAIKSSVIGIGLNVNQRFFDPSQVKTAVSLAEILQKDVNLIQLLAKVCAHIEAAYLKLKANKGDSLHEDYIAALYRYDLPSLYRHNGEIFEGKIINVTEQGMLVITVAGRDQEYNFKEVEFLSDPHFGQ